MFKNFIFCYINTEMNILRLNHIVIKYNFKLNVYLIYFIIYFILIIFLINL